MWNGLSHKNILRTLSIENFNYTRGFPNTTTQRTETDNGGLKSSLSGCTLRFRIVIWVARG